MSEIRVKLDHEDCSVIERGWYEYNASKDIIGYLMSQDKVDEKYLQQYINITECRYVELELKKRAVDLKYRPKDLRNKVANYEFDFENEELIYTIED